MTKISVETPTSCCPSVRKLGRTCWSGQCSLSNCSARRRSLPTIPITARDRAMRRLALALLLYPMLAASALAQSGGDPLDTALKAALAEQSTADAETARL